MNLRLKAAVLAAGLAAVVMAPAAGAATIDVSPVAMRSNDSGLPKDWNRSASFIEIFVRSYQDSDGDGVGDLKGLTSRLDYLQSLGITGIWLMPIMPSTDHDHGYAVEDYRAIDPSYGTMADFETLVREAHKRGIGIIMDYVMNHAGSSNPIFVDAETLKASPYRDWFLFADSDPKWKNGSWRAIDGGRNGYFYGIFDRHMPDWNLRNPKVVQYHADTLRFWLNKGVDGFRFDAVTMFVENGPDAFLDQPENKPILKQMRDVIDAYPNRYMICEASETPTEYVRAGACDNAFAFGNQTLIRKSAKTGVLEAGVVTQMLKPEAAHMPLILGNHDSFAGDRAIHDLSGHDEGDYRAAAAITLLASATPFTYYGEEVGMSHGGRYDDPGLRSPMSWTGAPPAAGFSTVKPYRALAGNYQSHNVAAEHGVSSSLLETYRALYQVRKSHPVLGTGTLNLQSKGGDPSLIFTRIGPDETAAVMINLTDKPQTLSVATGQPKAAFVQAVVVAGAAAPTPVMSDDGGRITAEVPAKAAFVFVRQGH